MVGGGGPREPGGTVGGEPEAGPGWILNTLGGIRHAGSRPARARAPKSVPVKRRAGLKGGSVCGREGPTTEAFSSGQGNALKG